MNMRVCAKFTFDCCAKAARFLSEKVRITNVTWSDHKYQMWVKEFVVAEYNERLQELKVFCDLDWYSRLYGRV